MTHPWQLRDGEAAAATDKRLRELEAEVRALQDQLYSARVLLRDAGPRGITLGDDRTRQAAQDHPSLAAAEAENTALRRANAGLAEEGRALRASEGQLARLLDAAPVAILETDDAGTFIYANGAAANILGLTGLRVEGRRYDALEWHLSWLDGRAIEPQERPIARALRGEQVDELEIRLAGPDKTHQGLVLRVGAVPVRGVGGRIEGALVTLVDVTARHAVTAALQASEERSRLAFEMTGACAWELDPATGLSSWDTAARTLLGLPEVLSFADAVAGFVHHDDRGGVHDAVTLALDPAGGGRYALEHRAAEHLSASGTQWLQSLGQAYFEGEGVARRPVRLVCVTTDVTQRRAAEERRALLVAELNHRVKNTLAVVQALAEQTRRATDKRPPGSPERRQFHADFQSRLLALARAHDLLTRADWQGTTLREILATAAELFGRSSSHGTSLRNDGERLEIAGPPVRVGPEAAVTLTMGIHELATNAAKHGALSLPGGRVTITWEIVPDRSAVDLLWAEAGGPPVSGPPPTELHGFGLRLLERGLPRQLGGSVQLDFAPDGLRCRIRLPLSKGRISPR
jgi:PAS domain S-box-containing protein